MHFRTVPASCASILAIAAFTAGISAQARPSMQSGGLAPPPPGSGPPPPPPPQRNATQQALEEAEQRDSGRGLEFFYFEAGGGAEFVALDALGGSGVFLPESKSAIGPVVSVASGVRLLYWTIGPRFRFGHFGDWNLFTINLDLGFRIPLGQFEPYAYVGGGFAKLDYSAVRPTAAGAQSTLSLSGSGFDVRLGGGADYYITNVFSVGGTLSLDLLRLSRSGDNVVAQSSHTAEASTLGLAVTAGAMLGLHF